MSLRTLACLLLLALAASAFAQTRSNRAALAAFLGHWEGSGKFADTKFSKAQTVTSTTKGQDVFGQKFSADSAADKPEVFALANAGAVVSSTAPLKVLYWREVPLP